MIKAAELVCPEKLQAFANISLTRNSIAERILELRRGQPVQTQDPVISCIFMHFLLQLMIATDSYTDIFYSLN